MFKVAIINGENCKDYSFFQEKCINILRKKAKEGERIIIYTLGDEYVERFSKRFGIETITIPCDWKRDGKSALKVCSETIIKDCNALICFDDNRSNILWFYNAAKSKGIPIRKITLL